MIFWRLGVLLGFPVALSAAGDSGPIPLARVSAHATPHLIVLEAVLFAAVIAPAVRGAGTISSTDAVTGEYPPPFFGKTDEVQRGQEIARFTSTRISGRDRSAATLPTWARGARPASMRLASDWLSMRGT